jgi:hypothetical protein
MKVIFALSYNYVCQIQALNNTIELSSIQVNPNTDICVDVKMDRVDPVVKSQACHVKAYDYYDPGSINIDNNFMKLLKSFDL